MKMQKIGDVLQSFDSARVPIKAADRVPGEIPYLGASGVVDHVDGFTHDGSFLCVAEDGANLLTRSLPIAWVQDGAFWANNHLHVLGGVSRNRLKFFQYAIELANIASFVSGSAQPKLNQASLRRVPVPDFGIVREETIGNLLCALDDKIAADTSAMFMAEQLIDALVYENVSTNFSVSIADELILHYGKSLPASKRVPGQIPVIGSGGIVGWHSSPLIEDPTVVVGRKGSIGTLHWIDSSSFPIDTTFWVQPKRLPTRILYSLLKLVDFSGSNTDSAVPGLNRSVAYEMALPFISDEAVAAVWDRVSSLDALCSHLKREVACLAKTRDELLPLLMSGKITVKDAEQEANAAGADIASEENKA